MVKELGQCGDVRKKTVSDLFSILVVVILVCCRPYDSVLIVNKL